MQRFSRGTLIAVEDEKSHLPMHNDHTVVDDLIAEIADSKSSYHEVAVEQLKRLCLQSCDAYDYLQGRVLDSRLPEYTQRRLGDVLATVRTRLYACQECRQTCQITSRHDNATLNYVLRHHCVPKVC